MSLNYALGFYFVANCIKEDNKQFQTTIDNKFYNYLQFEKKTRQSKNKNKNRYSYKNDYKHTTKGSKIRSKHFNSGR